MMNNIRRETNVFNCTVVQVICVKSRVGNGTKDDPVRLITEYFNFDGELLARVDREALQTTID